MRNGSRVDVVDPSKVQHHQANRRQSARVGNTRGAAEPGNALLAHDGPVALFLGAVGAVVDWRVVRLDRVEDAAG